MLNLSIKKCTNEQTKWQIFVAIIGAELHRGHGGEDEAFSERPETLSGI